MKALKTMMVVFAVICILPTLAVKEAQALGWYTCWVNYASQTSGNKYLKLTNADGSTTPIPANTPFTIAGSSAAENTVFFSIALTAMASGMKVVVQLDEVSYGNIYSMGLTDQ